MSTHTRRSSKHQARPTETDLLAKLLSSSAVNIVGNYVLGKTLGEGSFGKVKLGTHTLTGQEVAVKVVDKIHAAAVAREIETWRHLHHPNIAQLYEVLVTESKIYMITEYCEGGEAFDYLCSVRRLDDTDPATRNMFREIVEAVGYCHEKNFVPLCLPVIYSEQKNRDLKLENVLLSKDLSVKVIDFGFTRPFNDRNLLDTYCGSVAYAAPEMIMGKKYSGPQADIWSLGVILYTLLCGSLPFDDDNEQVVHQKISELDYVFPDFLSGDSKSLISQILQTNPMDRISVREILAHRWFSDPQQHTHALSAPLPSPTTLNAVAPSFSTAEETQICAEMHALGLDVESILDSVAADACDSASALWYLLVGRLRERRRKELFASANTTSSEPATAQDETDWSSRDALFGSSDTVPGTPNTSVVAVSGAGVREYAGSKRGSLSMLLGAATASPRLSNTSAKSPQMQRHVFSGTHCAAGEESDLQGSDNMPRGRNLSSEAVPVLKVPLPSAAVSISYRSDSIVAPSLSPPRFEQMLAVETMLAEARRRRSLNPAANVPGLLPAPANIGGGGGALGSVGTLLSSSTASSISAATTAIGTGVRRQSVGILAAAQMLQSQQAASTLHEVAVSVGASASGAGGAVSTVAGNRRGLMMQAMRAGEGSVPDSLLLGGSARAGGRPHGRRAGGGSAGGGSEAVTGAGGSSSGSSRVSSAASSPKPSTPRQIVEEDEDETGSPSSSGGGGTGAGSLQRKPSNGRRKQHADDFNAIGSVPSPSASLAVGGMGVKQRNRSIVEEDEGGSGDE
ncbi:kinase-like domain-containing protein [Chytriomyces sp. MP71]|nr:kinase-like domain-containing protein [Chytriomyces sp. MP71]